MSRDLMIARGYVVGKTEHWNAFAKIRQDLFGFIDMLCVKSGSIVGVQATSDSNVAARVAKIRASELLTAVKSSGIVVVVQGWKKPKRGAPWQVREITI